MPKFGSCMLNFNFIQHEFYKFWIQIEVLVNLSIRVELVRVAFIWVGVVWVGLVWVGLVRLKILAIFFQNLSVSLTIWDYRFFASKNSRLRNETRKSVGLFSVVVLQCFHFNADIGVSWLERKPFHKINFKRANDKKWTKIGRHGSIFFYFKKSI